MLGNSIMGNLGGMSMRPGLPAIKRITAQNRMANYVLYMRRRKTGLLARSGTLNNNV